MKYGKNLLTSGLFFIFCTNAQATLTATANGLGVYDSGINATWTQDANLLGTLEANALAQNGNDSSLITNIINASGGVIHDTPNYFDNGAYTLTAADFGSNGAVDWWAGQAFVHYLNTINYGGSNQWALPSFPSNSGYGVGNNGNQLAELFYNELGGTAGSPTYSSGSFMNIQFGVYWSGTEDWSSPNSAWVFGADSGYYHGYYKDNQPYIYSGVVNNLSPTFYAWAVSPGQAVAVPTPSAFWLFCSALAGFIGVNRRKSLQQ